MDREELEMIAGIPGFIQQAAMTALDHFDEITAQMREVYFKRYLVVKKGLADCPKIKLVEPDSGMFMLVDIRELNMSSEQFTWALFEHAKVSTLDAAAFGNSTKGFIRLSFTISEEQLAQACQRIKTFIAYFMAQKVVLKASVDIAS